MLKKKTQYCGILLILALFFVLGVGCKQEEKPPISETKMIAVLTDVHIMEAALQGRLAMEKDSLAKLYYYHIYKLHHISEQEFYNGLSYYSQRPARMESIYEVVLDSIQKKPVMSN